MGEELYDTSALIGYWRKGIRGLEGHTTIFCVIEFPKALKFRGLKVIYPTQEDYDEAIKIAIDLLRKGTPVGSVDVIISAMAINRNLTLVTTDKDFERIRAVRPKLKLRFARL